LAGRVPFTSFPEWARVCGGIMECAGYDSPCKTEKDNSLVGGDSETDDMRALFEVCYAKYPEKPIKKAEIRYAIAEESIFSSLDFERKRDQTIFGQKIDKFAGRVLSDICLLPVDLSVRAARREYRFTKQKREKSVFDYDSKVL
jgi:hypothetical protein